MSKLDTRLCDLTEEQWQKLITFLLDVVKEGALTPSSIPAIDMSEPINARH